MAQQPVPILATYQDYVSWPDDGRRYELYDGEVYVVPSPSVQHQRTSRRLVLALQRFVDEHHLGEVFSAPLDVVLAVDTVVQPDVLFVSAERSVIVEEACIAGAPDLVIEILSPGTARRDRITKLQLYCRYGVRECWLVDPQAQTIEVLSLSAAGARSMGLYGPGDEVASTVLPGLRLPVTAVFGA